MRHLIVLAALLGALQVNPPWRRRRCPAGPAPGKFAAPPCDGDVANVRLTEIIPGGTMEGYLQAVDAHRAWYRAHGYKDNEIFVSKLMVEDPATHKLVYSTNRVRGVPYPPAVHGREHRS